MVVGGGGGGGEELVAWCQPQLVWPPPSPPPPLTFPLPLNTLKSHFQARHRINLWALQFAGSPKQDVGFFFLLLFLSLSVSWLTFLPLEEFGRAMRFHPPPQLPPTPPCLGAVQLSCTLIALLWLCP